MTSKARVVEQTAIRRVLLANGYTPLANNAKACYLKGWSQLEVDEAMIDDWSGMLAYQSTGMRVDPPLVAIDIDIDDEEVVYELFDKCAAIFGEVWASEVLIRYGGGAKEMWVCRVDEPFQVPPGPKFVKPGEDVTDREVKRHFVEMFGGASGKQIGAFGIHTPGATSTDEPLVNYAWQGGISPLEVPLKELPSLSQKQCFQIVTWAAEIQEAKGWVRDHVYNPEDYSGEIKYDLTDEMTFVCGEGRGPIPYAKLAGEKKCRMREIVGEGSNPERGRVYTDEDGWAWVWDSATHCRHLHASRSPKDLGDLFAGLADRISSTMTPEVFEERVERETSRAVDEPAMVLSDLDDWHWDDWQDLVDKTGCEDAAIEWLEELGADLDKELDKTVLLFENLAELRAMKSLMCRRYVYYGLAGADAEVYDLLTAQALSLKVVKNTYASLKRKVPNVTPAGNASSRVVHAMDLWLDDLDNRVTVTKFQFDPASDKLFTPGLSKGTLSMNAYRPMIYTAEPDPRAPEVFEAFVEHLFPDPRERDWFVNHVAYKVQHPGERGQAVIMISERGRVGRGTFNQILYGMFDARFTKNLRAMDLIGESSRWTDWQDNCVMVVMDEVIPNPLDKRARLGVATALDDLVDNRPARKVLEGKGVGMRQAMVHWTGYLETNHFNAIALPPKDKRFTVLSNTEVRIDEAPEMRALLESVQDGFENFTEEFLHGVQLYLMGLETDRKSFMEGIDTEAKMDMIASGEGQVQHALREVLALLDADEKVYAWLPNIQHEVAHRVTNEFAKAQSPTEVRKALAQGFEGWYYDAKMPFKIADEKGNRTAKRVVQKGNRGEIMSAEARSIQLGPLKVLRGGRA